MGLITEFNGAIFLQEGRDALRAKHQKLHGRYRSRRYRHMVVMSPKPILSSPISKKVLFYPNVRCHDRLGEVYGVVT